MADTCDMKEAKHFAIAKFISLSTGHSWSVYDCALYLAVLKCGGFDLKICRTDGVYEVDCGGVPIWNSVNGELPTCDKDSDAHASMMAACHALHVAYETRVVADEQRIECEKLLAAASLAPAKERPATPMTWLLSVRSALKAAVNAW